MGMMRLLAEAVDADLAAGAHRVAHAARAALVAEVLRGAADVVHAGAVGDGLAGVEDRLSGARVLVGRVAGDPAVVVQADRARVALGLLAIRGAGEGGRLVGDAAVLGPDVARVGAGAAIAAGPIAAAVPGLRA